MNLTSSKLLKQIYSSFAVATLLLSTLVSNPLAFALKQDCGPHRIELCSEHNNSHFVKTHTASSNNDSLAHSESSSTSSSHDNSHQIEIDNPYNAITAKQVNEQSTQVVSAIFVSEFVFSSQYEDKYQFSSLDPPQANSPLSYLKTVRLII